MHRLRTILIAALALGALLSTTAAGCGSDTTTVSGNRNETVKCDQVPYNYTLSEPDPGGTGIVVDRGHVRGGMFVTCTGGAPETFSITVTLLRNGLAYGNGQLYTGIPTAAGHVVGVFMGCLPGQYRLQYRVRWTLAGVAKQGLYTVETSQAVTQHDCDA